MTRDEVIAELRVLSEDEPMLAWFQFAHLKSPLAERSEMFARVAVDVASVDTRNVERSAMLRKLLEAKDAAVRSLLYTRGEAQ